MRIVQVDFPKLSFPYLLTEPDSEAQKLKIYNFKLKHSFWGVVLECFAAHVQHLLDNAEDPRGKKSVKDYLMSGGIALADYDTLVGDAVQVKNGKRLFVFSDSAVGSIGELHRANHDHVNTMNWYCYVQARKAVLSLTNVDRNFIDNFEWGRISAIQSMQHFIHYPRPADKRDEYLSEHGIGDIPVRLL